MSRHQKSLVIALCENILKSAPALAIEVPGMSDWSYVSKIWARKGSEHWLWAVRSRLGPVQWVAKAVKAHLCGILNTAVLKVSNDPVEGRNSRIK